MISMRETHRIYVHRKNQLYDSQPLKMDMAVFHILDHTYVPMYQNINILIERYLAKWVSTCIFI